MNQELIVKRVNPLHTPERVICYHIENEDYCFYVEWFTDPDTGEIDYRFEIECGVGPKVEEVDICGTPHLSMKKVPKIFPIKISPVECLANPYAQRNESIGYSPFETIPMSMINESSPEEYRKAKEFAIALDKKVREMFPGWGLLHHDDEEYDPVASKKRREERWAADEWYRKNWDRLVLFEPLDSKTKTEEEENN